MLSFWYRHELDSFLHLFCCNTCIKWARTLNSQYTNAWCFYEPLANHKIPEVNSNIQHETTRLRLSHVGRMKWETGRQTDRKKRLYLKPNFIKTNKYIQIVERKFSFNRKHIRDAFPLISSIWQSEYDISSPITWKFHTTHTKRIAHREEEQKHSHTRNGEFNLGKCLMHTQQTHD